MIMTESSPITSEEQYRLATAVAHNCECQADSEGFVTKPCIAHIMLSDERAVKDLVFGARIAARLLREEFKE